MEHDVNGKVYVLVPDEDTFSHCSKCDFRSDDMNSSTQIKICNDAPCTGGYFVETESSVVANKQPTPRKWNNEIIAWANGFTIQYSRNGDEWYDTSMPTWDCVSQYRIKPELVYPETTLTISELYDMYMDTEEDARTSYKVLADAVIKHFIVSGAIDLYLDSIKSQN